MIPEADRDSTRKPDSAPPPKMKSRREEKTRPFLSPYSTAPLPTQPPKPQPLVPHVPLLPLPGTKACPFCLPNRSHSILLPLHGHTNLAGLWNHSNLERDRLSPSLLPLRGWNLTPFNRFMTPFHLLREYNANTPTKPANLSCLNPPSINLPSVPQWCQLVLIVQLILITRCPPSAAELIPVQLPPLLREAFPLPCLWERLPGPEHPAHQPRLPLSSLLACGRHLPGQPGHGGWTMELNVCRGKPMPTRRAGSEYQEPRSPNPMSPK